MQITLICNRQHKKQFKFTVQNTSDMNINWYAIALVVLCGIALIAYILRQNRKDKKNLRKRLNEDYKKRGESELNDER